MRTPTLLVVALAAITFVFGCSEDSPTPTAIDASDSGITSTDGNGMGFPDVESNACADLDCEDNNICTTDSCDAERGECINERVSNGEPCDDGDSCSQQDTCIDGLCTGGELLGCEDDNSCTIDSCDSSTGECVHANATNDETCDDGSLCTDNDHCADGSCVGGESIACDDENPCTDDTCDAVSGCVYTPNEIECDDGSLCTTDDQCEDGTCVGEELDCSVADPCMVSSCDPTWGCTTDPIADGTPCDDGIACTSDDTCQTGQCTGGTANDALCATDDLCVTDICDVKAGCVSSTTLDCCGNGLVEETEDCDDGNTEDGDGCSTECSTENPPIPEGWETIPAGSFMMGSPEDDNTTNIYKSPVHEVTLTRPFAMQATEVTQAQWQSLMGNNPSSFGGCADCPVENVSWFEALAYCNALSEQAGYAPCFDSGGDVIGGATVYECEGYRLPTEAEWEYAYRAGTTTRWYCGDDASCVDSIGWYSSNSGNKTHEVGVKTPNDWGLYDMAGNVWEWTWDWWDSSYYATSPSVDPTGPSSGSYRVDRGGGWGGDASYLRAADRNYYSPGNGSFYLGFRPARSLNP